MEYLRFFLNYYFTHLLKLCTPVLASATSPSAFQFNQEAVELVARGMCKCHETWVGSGGTAEYCLAGSSAFFCYLLAFFYGLFGSGQTGTSFVASVCVESLTTMVREPVALRLNAVFLLGQFLLATDKRTRPGTPYVDREIAALDRRNFLSFCFCVHSVMSALLAVPERKNRDRRAAEATAAEGQDVQTQIQRLKVAKLRHDVMVYMLYGMEDLRVRHAFLTMSWGGHAGSE